MSKSIPFEPSLSQASLADQLLRRFEEALRAGEKPRLEDYLAGLDDPVRSAVAKELRRLQEANLVAKETVEHGPAKVQAATISFLPAAPIPEEPPPTPPGSWPELDDYEIIRQLGRGGMGVVYQARQRSLKRMVALKMILGGPLADEHQRARFHAEADAVARLNHPNIVHIFQIGEHSSGPFYAMEYVNGGSLAEALAGKPQPFDAAAGLVSILALAMHYAHQQGIVHRDLKPANVLLQKHEDGDSEAMLFGEKGLGVAKAAHPPLTPKISDFGLAKQLDADSGQTRTGTVLGTPSYMAPVSSGN